MVPPTAVAAAPRRGAVLVWVLAAVLGTALLVGGLVWYATGPAKQPREPKTEANTSSEKAAATPNPETDTNDTSSGQAEEPQDSRATYDLLQKEYEHLQSLHEEIGLANTDGSYGGTGFAYEAFNPAIGSKDRGKRARLVTQCDALYARVEKDARSFDDLDVGTEYAEQKPALASLYGLLLKRVGAMRDAAKEALDHPEQSAWRPILTPANSDARKAFEADYPSAAPVLLDPTND